MAYVQCEQCKAHYFEPYDRIGPHRCPPLFVVWDPENGDERDGRRVYASDYQSAAEKWADLADSEGEYGMWDGNEVDVLVRGANDLSGEAQAFVVSGQMHPTYSATPKRVTSP
jgi:hypothetical protein